MSDTCVIHKRNIPIPRGWSGLVISDRVSCGEYVKTGQAKQVGRKVRAAAFFCYLKSLSTSGKVAYNIKLFTNETGLSADTVRDRIAECECLGWLERSSGSLLLSAWSAVLEADESAYTSCHLFEWEIGDIDKIRYAFAAYEIAENKERISKAYNNGIKIRGLKAALERIGATDRAAHHMMQCAALRERSEHPKGLLFSLNADDNRSIRTIREAHGYKSRRSVGYLKRMLVKHGLAEVFSRWISTNCQGATAGAFTRRWHTKYNSGLQVRTTYLPDEIRLKIKVPQ